MHPGRLNSGAAATACDLAVFNGQISAVHVTGLREALVRFIGEHDPQATTAPGGSLPGFPHSIWKAAFLKAFWAATSRLG
jgi:hypothetical protein